MLSHVHINEGKVLRFLMEIFSFFYISVTLWRSFARVGDDRNMIQMFTWRAMTEQNERHKIKIQRLMVTEGWKGLSNYQYYNLNTNIFLSSFCLLKAGILTHFFATVTLGKKILFSTSSPADVSLANLLLVCILKWYHYGAQNYFPKEWLAFPSSEYA